MARSRTAAPEAAAPIATITPASGGNSPSSVSSRRAESGLNLVDVTLEAVGLRLRVRCARAAIAAIVRAGYGALEREGGVADVTYAAGACDHDGYCLHFADRDPVVATDAGDFLMLLESELTIDLQKRRPDLFFLHAAALAHEGRAVLLVGASGAGKSTAAWGLTHEGFGYLSDELAPLDPRTLLVAPYPRALCLKGDPAPGYPVPLRTLRTPRTLHVPADALPGGVVDEALALGALFFVGHDAGARRPRIEPVTRGEAAARLLAQALNPLAHADAGLDAAGHVASAVPGFRLTTAALPATAALVRATLSDCQIAV